MAGWNKKNRLSPPLMSAFRAAHEARDAKRKLDLRDAAGERILAGRRAAGRAAITEPVLRREVAIDLGHLLNTVNMESSFDLGEFEHVRRSILNFGFPDIAHRSIDEDSVKDIKSEIETVLNQFEPRLVGDSIQVSRDAEIDAADLKIRFIIRAELSCEPLNVPVEFVADVELDTGEISINRR